MKVVKLEYKPVPADLRDIINTVSSIARGYMENRDLNFCVSREELKTPYVMADELRIREVLLNIISNAVKFTKDGGTISFVAENCPGNDEHHVIVRYRISDTGIGMSEEFQSRIFDGSLRKMMEQEPVIREPDWGWQLLRNM